MPVVFKPVVGVVIVFSTEGESRVAMWNRGDEALGICLARLVGIVGASASGGGRRDVVDPAGHHGLASRFPREADRVVFMTAVTAEVDRVKPSVASSRKELLAVHRDDPGCRRLDGGVGAARTGDELVELEGEEGPRTGVRAGSALLLGPVGLQEEVPECGLGNPGVTPGVRGKPVGGLPDGQGARPVPLLFLVVGDAERDLDPDRKRVVGEVRVRQVTGDSVPRCPDDRIVKVRQDVCAGLARVRSPAERLGDDVTGVNAGGKQCGRDLGDGCLALGGGPFTTADHGCRGADADKTIGRKPFPHTPDQEGDIGPLPSPVGMQLIQDEKPEAGTVPNDLAVKVVLPGHQELEHHEVGQQDVGRVRSNAHPFLVTLLARVPLELDWAGNARPEVVEVLLELLKLAVRQGVHGVDDDRPGPPGGIVIAFTEDCIDDGNEEAERFA